MFETCRWGNPILPYSLLLTNRVHLVFPHQLLCLPSGPHLLQGHQQAHQGAQYQPAGHVHQQAHEYNMVVRSPSWATETSMKCFTFPSLQSP